MDRTETAFHTDSTLCGDICLLLGVALQAQRERERVSYATPRNSEWSRSDRGGASGAIGRGFRSRRGGASGAIGRGFRSNGGGASGTMGERVATHSAVVAVDVRGAVLSSDGVQLHAGVVVGNDVVVAVLAPVGGLRGGVAREGLSHLNGAKLLKEQLIVVGPHHQQLVHEASDWHGRMALQG